MYIMNKKDLEQAIKSYDIATVTKYVQTQKIDKNDEDILYLTIYCRNFNAFELLIDKIDVKDREFMMVKAISTYLPIAMNLVENSEFDKFDNRTNFSDYNITDSNRFFPKQSVLERDFNSIVFKNNKNMFIAQILHKSLNFNHIGEDDFLVTNYLIENRKDLGVSDQQIIQYIVEQNYILFSGNSISYFEKTIACLISENVDLSFDQKSYLLQIAAFNNLTETIIDLHNNNCIIENFLNRYNNNNNWLSESEENLFNIESDCNNERRYDIYKKFDTTNNLKHYTLKNLCTILYNEKMNKKFPSHNKLHKNIKI